MAANTRALLSYRAKSPAGMEVATLRATELEAQRDALIVMKMAQESSDDADDAEAWVDRLAPAQLSAAWEALRAHGWSIVEVFA